MTITGIKVIGLNVLNVERKFGLRKINYVKIVKGKKIIKEEKKNVNYHKKISFIKSFMRIIGFFLLLNSFFVIGISFLIIAEITGIIEELK